MATVELRRPYDGKKTGEKIEVDEQTATSLVRQGFAAGDAKYAPIPESEKPESEPEPKKTPVKKVAQKSD